MSTLGYGDIVPAELQDELIHIRDQHTDSAWMIGDICLMIKDLIDQEKKHYIGMMDIYSAVGSFAGKSSRTIREYAMIAKFFPKEIREAYGILSINHFRKAHSVGTLWRVALEWCIEITEMTGRPATVDALEVYIQHNLSGYRADQEEGSEADGEAPAAVEQAKENAGMRFFETMINRTRGMKKAITMSRPPALSDEDFEMIYNSLCGIEAVLEQKIIVDR